MIATVLEVETKKALATESSEGGGIESIPNQIDKITFSEGTSTKWRNR